MTKKINYFNEIPCDQWSAEGATNHYVNEYSVDNFLIYLIQDITTARQSGSKKIKNRADDIFIEVLSAKSKATTHGVDNAQTEHGSNNNSSSGNQSSGSVINMQNASVQQQLIGEVGSLTTYIKTSEKRSASSDHEVLNKKKKQRESRNSDNSNHNDDGDKIEKYSPSSSSAPVPTTTAAASSSSSSIASPKPELLSKFEKVWEEFAGSNPFEHSHRYRLERYGIVQCGRRFGLDDIPENVYDAIQLEEDVEELDLPLYGEYLLDAIKDNDFGTPLCRSLVFPPQSHYPSLFYSSEFHFIQSIVDTFSKSILCKDKPTRIQESETEYSHYALWPFLESIASFVSATNTDNITHFRTGETDLKSVSTIKSDIKYNADGVLYLDGSHLELLLLEVSQAHGHSVDKHKHVYDHLKGAYGCIAMLNKIITTYKYGSRELVQNLRVLFLHASGRDDCLRLWIMRPSLNGTVVKFERVLKEELVIDRTRVSPITNIIQFLYKVKLHYDVAVSALNELKNSDDQNSMKKNKDSLVGFLSPAPFKPNRKNNQCAGIAILDPTSEL